MTDVPMPLLRMVREMTNPVLKVYRIQWTQDDDPQELSALFVETNDPKPGDGILNRVLRSPFSWEPTRVYHEWEDFPDPEKPKKLIQKDHIGYTPRIMHKISWIGSLSKAIYDRKNPLGANYRADAEGGMGRTSTLGPKISTLRREDLFRVIGQEGREAECECRCTCGKNVRWEDEVEALRPARLLLASALLVLANEELFHKGRFPDPESQARKDRGESVARRGAQDGSWRLDYGPAGVFG